MRCVWQLSLGVVLASCAHPASRPDETSAPDAGVAAPPITLELVAGDIGGPGNLDGPGAAARFQYPADAAVDASGNVYVADTDNHTIRKVTPAGVVTTLAGLAGAAGADDGTGAAARFRSPQGVAVDASGSVYVADTGNHTIRRITPAGVVATLAGSAGTSGSADGAAAAARFAGPEHLAIDGAGTLFVADTGNHTIRKITPGKLVTTLAGSAGMAGVLDGTGAAARFTGPTGIATDGSNVYVADDLTVIRRITAAGAVTTLAGTPGMQGSADGDGAQARFHEPHGLAADPGGTLYVADTMNHTIRRITAGGTVTTLAGTPGMRGSVDGGGTAARFNEPSGIAIDGVGTLYITDRVNHSLRTLSSSEAVTTLAGAAGRFGSVDGPGATARLSLPWGVAADRAGNIYVADGVNNTIRRIGPDGVVATLAGAADQIGSTDGPGPNARFFSPLGVAVDSRGNLCIADSANELIRRISPAGVVDTVAGAARMSGGLDGPARDARFYGPDGLAVDGGDNLYVADRATLRRITPAGVVTTVAGLGDTPGTDDGTGAAARFDRLESVAADAAGNVYATDTLNHTIRKITPAGVVTTLAGTAGVSGSVDGRGAAARFNYPVGITVDATGNLFVTDGDNRTIRKITPDGTVTTIAGAPGMIGVALGAAPRFATPLGVTVIGDSLVIADANAVLLLRHGAR